MKRPTGAGVLRLLEELADGVLVTGAFAPLALFLPVVLTVGSGSPAEAFSFLGPRFAGVFLSAVFLAVVSFVVASLVVPFGRPTEDLLAAVGLVTAAVF